MHLKYKKFVYTPIPKVACTTIKKEYIRLHDEKRVSKGKVSFSKIIDINEVHRFFEQMQSFHVPEREIMEQGWFHFIFIRNPYDRLVSGYLSKIRNEKKVAGGKYFEKGGVARRVIEKDNRLRGGVSFHQFVQFLKENPLLRKDQHFLPQRNFLSDDGWDNVDFIGRMEDFNQEWKRMCKLSGFPYRELMKTNTTVVRNSYREFYSDATRKVAEEIYGDDVEKFKYKF
jgi:hypothetical protein